ncbi:alpha/beta-hydrolase [Cylindrobasidium torrendii FP15055 ss-10]|uniref:Alpha/beta-hydrolase n=1 Tax=Cylindrobasidium torrendii FP15055 ss-10 TaxID=1314674 RepID=A0A0D7BB12_9AGAR|nr:alpha/beta-hydrolase [Cylindrobasidium torrendii FP15055 ss-10]
MFPPFLLTTIAFGLFTASFSSASPDPTPFQISVPAESIDLLHQKLALTTFPDELVDVDRDYGVPLEDLKRLVSCWKDTFDWRAQEAALNAELPQYTVDIDVDGFDTLNVHFVHQRSSEPNAIPLLFVHGWPGSFLEVRKVLPLLTEGSPSFHVVALSLPGFGFSEAPRRKGFGLPQFAEVGNKLMVALGYDKYVTQGGDWGSLITRSMGFLYGNDSHVVASHTNFPQGIQPDGDEQPYTDIEEARLARTEWYETEGMGYYSEQSTQPQTLGYALADSPAGLLAWIYEKLINWTDNYPWEDDEVLTWVSIYYFSRAGPAASTRVYYEFEKNVDFKKMLYGTRLDVPTGLSHFPKEIRASPDAWYDVLYNVVFSSQHDHGGHFAAHENPQVLVNDVKRMFGTDGPLADVLVQLKTESMHN